MSHLDQWEKDLRRRLAEHESPKPAFGWDKLAARMAEAGLEQHEPRQINAAPTPRTDKRRRRWAAAWATTLSAAACLTAVWLLDTHRPETLPDETIAPTGQAAASAQHGEPGARHTPLMAGNAAHTRPDRSAPTETTARRTATAEREAERTLALNATAPASLQAAPPPAAAAGTPQPVAAETPETGTEASGETDAQTGSTPPATLQAKTRAARTPRTYAPTPGTAKRTNRHTPTLALHAATASATRDSRNGYFALSSPSLGSAEMANTQTEAQNDLGLIAGENLNRSVDTRIHHHAPLQFGLSISIPLTGRWSLRTGLTYTRLSTDIESGSSASYYLTEQRLHYVGVPVEIGYTFFRSRAVNFYAGAGGTIEKCVKGTQTTAFHVADTYKSATETDGSVGRGLWQGSLHAAAGAQLNLTRSLGLYFEPRFTYYIPDGSSLPNPRHDQPWRLGWQAGLRFSLP